MKRRTLTAMAGMLAITLAGVVSAQTQEQVAQPATAPDPIGNVLKNLPGPAPAAQQPEDEAPPAPGDVPAIVVTPPTPPRKAAQDVSPPPVQTAQVATPEPEPEAEAPTEAPAETTSAAAANETPTEPGRRTRRGVAVIQALDKITAETMRFEVRVGGPPVRYKGLVFTARACEVSASDELIRDAVAYLEIRSQPRGLTQQSAARQVYRGWMYASAPAVTPLEHPIYDAWVVDCRA